MKWFLTAIFSTLFSALFIVLAQINPALAFQLNPISRIFAPLGQEATQDYEIVNDSDERVAVEVTVVERTVSLDGEETHTPADDDFLIYPPQMIVEPGTAQVVRVMWLGDPAPTEELAYRLVAEQLPINLVDPNSEVPERPAGQVQIMMRYIGALYIQPAGVTPDLQVVAATPQTSPEGVRQLAVTLDNQGTAHALLKNYTLHLTSQGTTIDFPGEQLDDANHVVVLAGHQRRFVVSWPAGLPQGEVTGTVRNILN